MKTPARDTYRYSIENLQHTKDGLWTYTAKFYKLPDQINPVHEVDLTTRATIYGIAHGQAQKQCLHWIDNHG